jgi:hypothetical protein
MEIRKERRGPAVNLRMHTGKQDETEINERERERERHLQAKGLENGNWKTR